MSKYYLTTPIYYVNAAPHIAEICCLFGKYQSVNIGLIHLSRWRG